MISQPVYRLQPSTRLSVQPASLPSRVNPMTERARHRARAVHDGASQQLVETFNVPVASCQCQCQSLRTAAPHNHITRAWRQRVLLYSSQVGSWVSNAIASGSAYFFPMLQKLSLSFVDHTRVHMWQQFSFPYSLGVTEKNAITGPCQRRYFTFLNKFTIKLIFIFIYTIDYAILLKQKKKLKSNDYSRDERNVFLGMLFHSIDYLFSRGEIVFASSQTKERAKDRETEQEEISFWNQSPNF